MEHKKTDKIKYGILRLIKGSKYKYSQSVQGDFGNLQPGELNWWKYKINVKQIERAEKGKGIEEYFHNQNLTFTLPQNKTILGEAIVSAGGDLLPGDLISERTTKHLWDDIEDFYFQGADNICANLESPIDVTKPKTDMSDKAPRFNGSVEMLRQFLRDGEGINVLSTANNHCLNQGEDGLTQTLNLLDQYPCYKVGTARDKAEQDDIPIVDVNGIKIAYLAYTFGLNGDRIPEGKEYLVNLVKLNDPNGDISLIKRHAAIAREKKADIIIACLHWSLEFESFPIQNVINMGHRILKETGIDVIVGNHAHVVQPIEKYVFKDPVTGIEKTGIIAYSLGNLVSDLHTLNTRMGILLRLHFTKIKDSLEEKTVLSGLYILPYYIYEEFISGEYQGIRLLPLLKTINAVRNKQSSYPFTKKQIKEMRHLDKVLRKVFTDQQIKYLTSFVS